MPAARTDPAVSTRYRRACQNFTTLFTAVYAGPAQCRNLSGINMAKTVVAILLQHRLAFDANVQGQDIFGMKLNCEEKAGLISFLKTL